MASTSDLLLLLLTFFCFISAQHASALEFEVGGMEGWIVPPENDTSYYNDWASENRFRLGDLINFKYKKDSVMEVREGDYKTCNSTHPLFFSNTGHTEYKLRSKRAYYFISGVAGHCERGQKVIIKVLAADESRDEDEGGGPSGSAAAAMTFGASKLLLVPLVAVLFQ
uniref:Phytocyanin domain-containing protein n=1 Tax=Kalanchoe fedtschenkoi TaxID=63787 RepID=A0A7N0T7H8_KALFE